MSNPLLNDEKLRKAAEADAGWAAPDAGSRVPMTDGPISPWNPRQGVMTVGGTASATAVLFVLMLVSAAVGWTMVDAPDGEVYRFPTMAIVGVLLGLVIAIALAFKPMWARVLAPVYALAQGVFVGAISRAYETYYDGIVLQAAGVTAAVFAAMLVMYNLRVIKVTNRFRRIVVGATLGLMVFYGVALLINLFGGSVSFLTEPSAFGIGFSLFVAALAAMNLALDFDFIERGSQEGLPKSVEWYAAFGVLVTVVWLYLEILRLLAKLRER